MQSVRASWVLAHDGNDHVVLRDGVVAWEGDTISYVGRGRPDLSPVDLPGHVLLPGLICLHSHAGSQASGRLIFHLGRRDVFGGGFQNSIPKRGATRGGPGETTSLGALATLAELVKGGATTVLEAGGSAAMCDALLAARETVPVRLILGPGYRSADYATEADGRLAKDWRPDGGMAALEAARSWIAKLPNGGAGDGMVAGVFYPSILDYCTAELLQETRRLADDLGVLIQIHAGQSVFEFHEVLHATGRTPIEWLADLGVLGPRTSLAHCFATTANPKTAYPGGRDLEILAETGTAVAHCPVAIGRRGNALVSLDRYQQAGVRVAIGCDSFPRDVINELRTASTIAKIVEGDFAAGSARSVLRAATTDAADAIGRPDLGRLAAGKAADLVAVDLRSFGVGVVRDPIDAMLSGASSRDVHLVVAAGRTIVDDGAIAGVDERAMVARMQAEAEPGWESVPNWHWTGGQSDDVFPRSFRLAREGEFRA